MANEARLSKSQYVRGLQCHKSLWLYRNRKDLIPEVPAAKQMIFDQGHVFGVLAHQRFPGGTLINEDHLQITEALTSTKAALDSGARILYEAGVMHDNVLVRPDIIIKSKDGKGWDLVEVKSSAGVHDVYLNDVAVQRHVMDGAGLTVRRAYVMHVNNAYVRKGEIDVKRLFTLSDVTEATAPLVKMVPKHLKAMQEILAIDGVPAIDIGPQCYDPYPCEFIDHCWEHVPDYSVFDLAGARFEKKMGLWRKGIGPIVDIPTGTPLSDTQAIQVAVAKSGRPHVDAPAIATMLDGVSFPRYFLDFETVNPAIPPYDGLRPFQKLAFQASVHVQERQGGPIKHEEFLDDGKQDPRPELISFLVRAIGAKGTVIAYNKGFEGGCLKELAVYDPGRGKQLLSMVGRLWDLAGPFRSAHYVHPGFEGSWSIKNVLPVLVPGMTYEGMPIHDGAGAQVAYLSLMGRQLPAVEAKTTMANLRAYCGQDTMAMVEILRFLETLDSERPTT